MKILITGNMGYIGPVVSAHLRSSMPGSFLAGLDIGYFGSLLNGRDVLPECSLSVQHFADIRKVPDYALEDINAVVHLAGISNDPIGNRFEDVTLAINHKASIQLAQQAKRLGAKVFVFASSCSMYGAAQDGVCSESSPLTPLTAYARSKAYAERDLQPLADKSFRITCLRFSTACGMSPRLRLDLVLNDFVAAAVASKQIRIMSDGTPWRPLINVKDMGRAIEWAIGREDGNGGPFLAVNIGRNDWNCQVKDLAAAVAAAMPGVQISINKDAQPDKRSYRVNFDLFQKVAPHHQPRSDLSDTIMELKNALEGMHFHDADFHNSQFIRLVVLDRLREKGLLNDRLEWESPRT